MAISWFDVDSSHNMEVIHFKRISLRRLLVRTSLMIGQWAKDRGEIYPLHMAHCSCQDQLFHDLLSEMPLCPVGSFRYQRKRSCSTSTSSWSLASFVPACGHYSTAVFNVWWRPTRTTDISRCETASYGKANTTFLWKMLFDIVSRTPVISPEVDSSGKHFFLLFMTSPKVMFSKCHTYLVLV